MSNVERAGQAAFGAPSEALVERAYAENELMDAADTVKRLSERTEELDLLLSRQEQVELEALSQQEDISPSDLLNRYEEIKIRNGTLRGMTQFEEVRAMQDNLYPGQVVLHNRRVVVIADTTDEQTDVVRPRLIGTSNYERTATSYSVGWEVTLHDGSTTLLGRYDIVGADAIREYALERYNGMRPRNVEPAELLELAHTLEAVGDANMPSRLKDIARDVLLDTFESITRGESTSGLVDIGRLFDLLDKAAPEEVERLMDKLALAASNPSFDRYRTTPRLEVVEGYLDYKANQAATEANETSYSRPTTQEIHAAYLALIEHGMELRSQHAATTLED